MNVSKAPAAGAVRIHLPDGDQLTLTSTRYDPNGLTGRTAGIGPVTAAKLDLGPWQAVFYCEFDGRRGKRLIIKVLGE